MGLEGRVEYGRVDYRLSVMKQPTAQAIRQCEYRAAGMPAASLPHSPSSAVVLDDSTSDSRSACGTAGAVYVDPIGAPSGASRLSASSVHFTPGARTAWHTHPNGQTLWVTEGVGLVQRRGGPTDEEYAAVAKRSDTD
jgi:hypothetical protein